MIQNHIDVTIFWHSFIFYEKREKNIFEKMYIITQVEAFSEIKEIQLKDMSYSYNTFGT